MIPEGTARYLSLGKRKEKQRTWVEFYDTHGTRMGSETAINYERATLEHLWAYRSV